MKQYPTPIAGLALGTAGICWFWSVLAPSYLGFVFIVGCLISLCIIIPLIFKFIRHPQILWEELKHPVVGSAIPTFAMTLMILSHLLSTHCLILGEVVWLTAIILHFIFFATFLYHQAKNFSLDNLIPGWYVPPIGIVVGCLTVPSMAFLGLAHCILAMGIGFYFVMLPMVLYRLILSKSLEPAKRPSLAILAAPASLTLAGYLATVATPNPLLVIILFGIALTMTISVYVMLFYLLRLEFSPAFSAYTFPLAISATAMYKFSLWTQKQALFASYSHHIRTFAIIEAGIASVVIAYVMLRYVLFFRMRWLAQRAST